jgi:hypothetical protein
MIVLRRPGPAEISAADAYIFRLVRQALVGREAAPCACYVVGPHGIRAVPEREEQPASDVEQDDGQGQYLGHRRRGN